METTVQEKINRILEVHNRISDLQNQVDERINHLLGDGSGSNHETYPPIEPGADLLHALDQIELRTQKIEERLHQTLEKLHRIHPHGA